MDDSIKLEIGRSVAFADSDISFFKIMAENKIKAKLRSNMSISNYGSSMTSLEKETMSIASETAFCRMVNIPDPDEYSIINNRYYDFKLFDVTIDIKATATIGAQISVATGRLFKNYADIFVLIRKKTAREYVFLGCILRDDIIQAENIKQPAGYKNEVYISSKFKNLELPCILTKSRNWRSESSI